MNRYDKSRIQPYRLAGKKCEKASDARDTIRLESSNIKNACENEKILIGGIGANNPEEIVSNPDYITDQLMNYQSPFVDDECSRSRRIYTTIYQVSGLDYGISLDEAFSMTKMVAEEYSDYPSIYAVSQFGDDIRIDMIFSNYSLSGEKLTQNYKPASMYNAYLRVRKVSG